MKHSRKTSKKLSHKNSKKLSRKTSKKLSHKNSKKTYNGAFLSKMKAYTKAYTTEVKNLFRTKDEICKDKFGKEYTYDKTHVRQIDCRHNDTGDIRSYVR